MPDSDIGSPYRSRRHGHYYWLLLTAILHDAIRVTALIEQVRVNQHLSLVAIKADVPTKYNALNLNGICFRLQIKPRLSLANNRQKAPP